MALQRKTIIRIAKWLIAVVVVIGLVWASKSALEQWQQQKLAIEQAIVELDASIQSQTDPRERTELVAKQQALQAAVPSLTNLRWSRIVLASALYAMGIFVPGLVLHQALASLGEHPRRRTSIAAQLIGHAGKYVPGKAMVIVLRAGALSQDNVAVKRATVAVFMETLLMMAVGATLACAVICWLPVPAWMMWTAIAMAIVASLPTLPPVLTRVAAIVSKTDETNELGSCDDRYGSWKFFVYGWTFSLVSWLLIGAAFSVLVTAIPHFQPSDSSGNAVVQIAELSAQIAELSAMPSTLQLGAVSTAAIGLAMVVGFASLLPGGAGVRELVLTTILATTIGMPHALLAAIAARLMFIVVEAVCAGLAWLWLRRQSKCKTSIQSTADLAIEG